VLDSVPRGDSGTDAMNKEVFGVFGDIEEFQRFRDHRSFDDVIQGDTLTVGIRDPALGTHGRSTYHASSDGVCMVWGEAFSAPSRDNPSDLARWFLDRFTEQGRTAFEELNGSYLAIVEHGNRAIVATDPIRSWECFHTDAP